MEVHHHAHTESLPAVGAGKRLKHHLFEFFMLFLAVFCGFLAENIRETMFEKRKAKEYIKSFVEDLRADTATCSRLIGAYNTKRQILLVYDKCYDSITKNLPCYNCTGALLQASSSFPDFINADRTLQQLKSAGGLRLLSKEDADSISVYDAEVRKDLQAEKTSFQEVQTVLRSISYQLINYDVMRFFTSPQNHSEKIPVTPMVFANNKQLQSKYFVALFYYLGNMSIQVENMVTIKVHAESLIHFFKKKYHLK